MMLIKISPIECVTCDAIVKSLSEFKDDESRDEFAISGMCQKCQDIVW